MTILELETTNSNEVVKTLVAALANDATLTEADRAAFNRLNADGYAQTIDETLETVFGSRCLRRSVEAEFAGVPFWSLNIKAYLKRRVEWFKKCFLYIDAEYNPVENYQGTEHEFVQDIHGERKGSDTDTAKPKTVETWYDNPNHQKTTLTPQIITEDYTEANIVTTKGEGDTTVTTQNAPFESSSWYNNSKEETKHGTITETEQPYNRKSKTPEHTITETEIARVDKVYEKHLQDETIEHHHQQDAAIDTHERNFDRHGNIGVLSAGELLGKDAEFWRAFGWLYDTAHDISNLISEGVLAL